MILRFYSFLIFVFILLQLSCFEPTSGCLDIEATNYDATADEQCEDGCCNYPNLKLTIFHLIESEGFAGQDTCINFSTDSTFVNGSGSQFQIDDMFFYLSDFRLTLSTGEVVQVTDTIQLSILDNAFTLEEKDTVVTDDFVLVKRTAFSYTLGEFISPGNYEKIEFKVGLNSRLNTTNPDTLDSTHPLAISRDSMHTGIRTSGYLMQKFEITRDTMALPDSYEYEILDPFTNTVEISLDYQFTVVAGFDVTLPVKVNYSEWLSGIDFATDDDATIKARIVSNTANAISIND